MVTNVEQFRRRVKPQYYDATIGASVTIPSITEDALILLPSEEKRRAVEYLKAILDAEFSQYSEDYNKLLSEVAEYEEVATDAIVKELDQIIGRFKTFVEGISEKIEASGAAASGGLQPLMRSMTRYLGQIVEVDQNERFHGRFTSYVGEQYQRKATLDLTRELRSWIRVLTQYP